MRAVFFGTPDIAVESLDALVEIATLTAVVCQPDRPAGRGLELRPPPVKRRAIELGIPVVQPEKIRTPDFASWMRDQRADFALVLAYGRILPPAILEAPVKGCLNLHASLLPKYRGAAPITWAIVRGERETGVSLMQMDVGCDTGPVFSRHTIPIGADDTADDLARALATLAATVVRSDVLRVVAGELTSVPQDEGGATMAPLLKKEDGRIRWDRPAREVHDHARGMTTWPGASTTAHGKLFKVLSTKVAAESGERGPAGTVVRADRTGIEIACASGSVEILRGQLEGKKALGAAELVAGRAVASGDVLGR